jgi:hypothetical protein
LRVVKAGLASGLDEVKKRWSSRDLFDALEWLDWIADEQEAQRKENEEEARLAAEDMEDE